MLTSNYQAALDKLNGLIAKGQTGAAAVVQHVMDNQPQDRIVKAGAMTFEPNHNSRKVEIITPDGVRQGLHRHAIGQMAGIVDMPLKYVDSLQDEKEPWGRELLAESLQTIYHKRFGDKRYLARSASGEVRGWLSDKYRRLDSRPIVEAFATELQRIGAAPYEGHVTDTKIVLRAILPKVYEPVPGELVAFGMSLGNSDYGAGQLELREYILRIWCNNLAVTEDTMRRVHLGKRLDDNIEYSQRTYELDTKTTVSAVRDVTKLALTAGDIEERMSAIQAANAHTLTPETATERLKRLLNKAEAEAAISAYKSPDVTNLPEGNNVWRLSNAISWIAHQSEDQERKLELARIAGEVLLPKAA